MELNIKKIRESKNMTQQELSKKSGVSRTIISALETRQEVVTTTATLQKISDAFGLNVSDLFLQ